MIGIARVNGVGDRFPIQSRNGFRTIADSGGVKPSSRLRYATRSGVKTRPAGSSASHRSATFSRRQPGAVIFQQGQVEHRVMRSSSSGIPSMFSARLLAALRLFHGHRSAASPAIPWR